jgi:hypothetical protein
MYKIVDKQAIAGVYRKSYMKYKYTVNGPDNLPLYYAIFWDGLEKPIVYDEHLEDEILKVGYRWIDATPYSYLYVNKVVTPLHRVVINFHKPPNYNNPAFSIDHINEYKTDNRIINLRMATQGQQNSNRGTRSDKKPPPEELLNIGITEYPKYVGLRSDCGEMKFVIEKHPVLMKEVANGIRKKPCLNGTKSRSLTLKEKFEDILTKLNELDIREEFCCQGV